MSGERGDVSTCRVLFFDDGSLEQFGVFELDPLEQGIACATCHLQCVYVTRNTAVSESVEYIVVGTARVVNDEIEPTRGRILVFEVTPARQINLVAEKETKGAVYTLAGVGGKLAAGIGSKVCSVCYVS